VAIATLLYIVVMLNRKTTKKKRTKREILTDMKVDEMHDMLMSGGN
jgi:hypothetical protein